MTILEDLHVELVHAPIHHLHANPDIALAEHGTIEVDDPPLLQAPQVPKSLHPALARSLPHLAELPHPDRSEKPLGLFGLVPKTLHCCAQIEVTPQILYSREADLDSEEPASNFVHRGGARKDRGFDSPCVSFF